MEAQELSAGRFKGTARELGANDSKAARDAKLRKLAKQKPGEKQPSDK